MLTRRSLAIAVAVGAASAAALGVTAATAATTQAKVTAGNAAVNTVVPVTGTSTTSQVFTNTRNGAKLICTSVSATGNATVKTTTGSGPYNNLAGITSSTWTGCKLQNLYTVTVTQPANNTWNINATGGTATNNGKTAGSISNIKATVAQSGGCTFTVGGTETGSTGRVYGDYQNGTSTTALSSLTINTSPTPNLKVLTVSTSPCLGDLIKVGDNATYSGSFSIKATTTSYNPVNVVVT